MPVSIKRLQPPVAGGACEDTVVVPTDTVSVC